MKIILMVLLITVLSLVVSVAQYYVTHIPGRIVFGPLTVLAIFSYIWANRAKVFRK